ncbi:MAG: hypothetical protein LC792_00925 [Actinobacteria bacterium]|nr:hypothetical protein [Actinomycetota bacterium]
MTAKGSAAARDANTAPSADLVPATNGLSTPTVNPWTELEDFDDGSALFREHFGLSVPRLRSDFGRNGQGWIDSLTGEVTDHLSCVLLAIPPTRAFWRKSLDEGGSGPPDCRSIDMVRPLADSAHRQSETCGTCPHSVWGHSDDGRPKRPACVEAANIVAYDVPQDRFVWVRFAGTALGPLRAYISALASRRKPMYAVVTEISLTSATRDHLQWLVPEFGIGAELTPEQVRPMRDVARMAMEQLRQVTDEMAAAETTEPAPAPAGEATHFEPDEEPF